MTQKPGKKREAAGLRETVLGFGSGLSGLMGLFSSWTVCHNVCTAAIALLAVIGIAVTGMPLLFLQKVAVPFWIVAVIIFSLLLFLKARGIGCLSTKLLMLNGGLIVFGTPLEPLQRFSLIFRIAGAAIILAVAASYLRGRLRKRAR